MDWDFNDPALDHTRKAIELENAGEQELAIQAFTAAAKHSPTHNTLANLGVAKMRRNLLDEAEDYMLQALKTAEKNRDNEGIEFVLQNLDNLSQHLAWRAGQPVQGAKYRRRAYEAQTGAASKAPPGRQGPPGRQALAKVRRAYHPPRAAAPARQPQGHPVPTLHQG